MNKRCVTVLPSFGLHFPSPFLAPRGRGQKAGIGPLKQQGFSLLEILIAFSILALSLGILLKIFSAGINTAQVAGDYNVAVQIAESLMARTGVETPLQTGEDIGLENKKFHWQVAVSPFQLTAENMDVSAINATLFKVKVTVGWDGANPGANGRQVELTTLKLANKVL